MFFQAFPAFLEDIIGQTGGDGKPII